MPDVYMTVYDARAFALHDGFPNDAMPNMQADRAKGNMTQPDGVPALQSQLPSWVNFPDFEKVSWVNSVIGAALRISPHQHSHFVTVL